MVCLGVFLWTGEIVDLFTMTQGSRHVGGVNAVSFSPKSPFGNRASRFQTLDRTVAVREWGDRNKWTL
jgi:hypothetical protein